MRVGESMGARHVKTLPAPRFTIAAPISNSHVQSRGFIEFESEKAYPRDFMQRGRVRVLLKWEDGSLFNPAISSRKQLMLQVAELIPRHPSRTKKQGPPSSSSASNAPRSGKAGKKKR